MKRIIKLTLVLLMLISVCACSNKKQNELAPLFEEGYQVTQTSYCDGVWKAMFSKEGSVFDSYLVELKMDQETFDKLFEIDIFEEEGEKQFKDIVTYLPDCTISSLKDEIPSEDEFDKYIGKTILDLENDGYERSGNIYSEDGCIFFADGDKYSLNVRVDENITFETMDDYSENDIRELIIKEIEFTSFSPKFLN